MSLSLTTIIGARPQFIKAAAVSRVIQKLYSDNIDEKIIHTGQHFDENMSRVFFTELQIPAPYTNLNIQASSHGAATGAMLAGIEEQLLTLKPDAVLVYGDTNSTLAGALAAAKLKIPVVHVEAGLRSFDRDMPEEINRVMTDHLSTLLLCPTKLAIKNLQTEGIERGVSLCGDVMYDLFKEKMQDVEPIHDPDGPFTLLTLHRPSNVDDATCLAQILQTVSKCPNRVIFPIHPRTRAFIEKNAIAVPDSICMIDPLPYNEIVAHLISAQFVMTDSGGLQKEASFAGKPCVVLRDTTEWRELVEGGEAILVGNAPDKIEASFDWVREKLARKQPPHSYYGDGHAAEKIVQAVLEKFDA